MRREAIDILLFSQRREGLWDSFVAGKIGAWVMSIEEEGMNEDGYIPEDARAYGENTELDMLIRMGTVRCRQNVKGMKGGFRIRETVIRW